jgi:hypothetical protein
MAPVDRGKAGPQQLAAEPPPLQGTVHAKPRQVPVPAPATFNVPRKPRQAHTAAGSCRRPVMAPLPASLNGQRANEPTQIVWAPGVALRAAGARVRAWWQNPLP